MLGADPLACGDGIDALPGRRHYFSGSDPALWRKNVEQFRGARFEGVLPGIDLLYHATEQGEIELDLILAAGNATGREVELASVARVRPMQAPASNPAAGVQHSLLSRLRATKSPIRQA